MTILITGANRGIGAALLAKYRAAGMDVLGTSRSNNDLLTLDVTDPASFDALTASLNGRAITPRPFLEANTDVLKVKAIARQRAKAPGHTQSGASRG